MTKTLPTLGFKIQVGGYYRRRDGSRVKMTSGQATGRANARDLDTGRTVKLLGSPLVSRLICTDWLRGVCEAQGAIVRIMVSGAAHVVADLPTLNRIQDIIARTHGVTPTIVLSETTTDLETGQTWTSDAQRIELHPSVVLEGSP